MNKEPGTLEDVIIGVLMRGGDRGALVRPSQISAGRDVEPAVCVLTLSEAARMRLTPPLLEILRELGDSPRRLLAEIATSSPLREVFASADGATNGWSWFQFQFGPTRVVGTVFVGPICDRVAAICTANGAPCSLDPDEAAPGYEVENLHNWRKDRR